MVIHRSLLLLLSLGAPLGAQPLQATRTPLVRVADLEEGQTQRLGLSDGSFATVQLVSVTESFGEVRGAVREARVVVEVDGRRAELVSANYHLPVQVGRVKIDCPITRGTTSNSRGNPWALDAAARLRLWPAGSPFIAPGTFGYPVKQRWFAGLTQMANEPTYVDGGEVPGANENIYYHYGLDFGGAEGLVEVVVATDGVVISSGTDVLPGYEDTPVQPRYDVVYVHDDRDWYYRYSHLASIGESIRPGAIVTLGQTIGVLGKEGGSGGWSHLHFDISSRQPSGRWGIQEGYAFVQEAYLRVAGRPDLVAIARPHRVAWTGEKVLLDGRRSLDTTHGESREAPTFEWILADGRRVAGATVETVYSRPGEYSEILKLSDDAGHTSYDFAVVQVFDRDNPRPISTIHPAYYPTTGIRPGDPVTFKVRSFRAAPGEIWDFGDGTPKVHVRSDGNANAHAANGYAVTRHVFEKSGDYIVRVEHTAENGQQAVGHLHVKVGEP